MFLNCCFDQSIDTSSGVVKMAGTEDKFNADNVLRLFKDCRQDDDILDTDCYVNGYEELSKYVNTSIWSNI